jgi:hypothetical protein
MKELVTHPANIDNFGDQHSAAILDAVNDIPVHVTPLGLVIILFTDVLPPATNNPISAAQQTASQVPFSDGVLNVHVIASCEVITLSVPTATSVDRSEDQHIEYHAAVWPTIADHVMPSGDVITRFVPLAATATNLDNLSAQQIEYH